MNRNKTICIIGPVPPPIGGMALQTQELVRRLREEKLKCFLVRTNYNLFLFLKLKGIKTFSNFLIYLTNLLKQIRISDTIFIMSCSHLYFFLHVYPAYLLSKVFKKKFVISYRGGAPQNFFAKYHKFLQNIFDNSFVIVPSEYLQNVFQKYFNIHPTIVPNIAYLEKFKFKGIRKLKPLFLCSRNFEPYYGVEIVVRSFAEIIKKHPNAKLGLIGDGKQKSLIIREIDNLGLKDKVKLYGRLNHDLLPKIYSEYDIYLNASRIDNFPGSIIEAFATGLLVITTNAGGIPFVVKDQKTGFLVPIDDYTSMSKIACNILNKPEQYNAIIFSARKEAEKYSWENIKKILLPILLD